MCDVVYPCLHLGDCSHNSSVLSAVPQVFIWALEGGESPLANIYYYLANIYI